MNYVEGHESFWPIDGVEENTVQMILKLFQSQKDFCNQMKWQTHIKECFSKTSRYMHFIMPDLHAPKNQIFLRHIQGSRKRVEKKRREKESIIWLYCETILEKGWYYIFFLLLGDVWRVGRQFISKVLTILLSPISTSCWDRGLIHLYRLFRLFSHRFRPFFAAAISDKYATTFFHCFSYHLHSRLTTSITTKSFGLVSSSGLCTTFR